MRSTTITTKALAVLLVGLFFAATGFAGSVAFTGAEQQVGLKIASKTAEEDDHIIIEEFSPAAPKGLGNAEINASHAYPDYSISTSGSLTSSFEPNKVTVDGSATASSAWVSPPSDAFDIHGVGCSIFRLYLSTGSLPADFHISGDIRVRMSGPVNYPEENSVYVRLSATDKSVIWEKALDGPDTDATEAMDQAMLLPAGQSYVLEAYAIGTTVATLDRPGSTSSTASFHFTVYYHSLVCPRNCPDGSSTDGTNDLAGTWYIHSLASGPVGRWWEYGQWTINGDYSFSGIINEYKKAPAEISGRFLLAPNGVATFVGAPQDPDAAILPRLHMAANKSVIAGVTTWSAGFPGTTQIMLLTRRAESYQMSDLEGTWYVHSLASGPGTPWWQHGSLTVGADGSFQGMLREYKSALEELAGRFQIDPNGVVTVKGLPDFTTGHMDSGKNVIVMVDTWTTGYPGTTELKIFTRQAKSYSTADLAGRWYRCALVSGPGAPWWEYGPIDIKADGSFDAPVQQQYNSHSDQWSGQFQVDSSGVVTIVGKPVNPYVNGYGTLHLSADKNVIAGIASWSGGSPGSSEMDVFTRIPTAE